MSGENPEFRERNKHKAHKGTTTKKDKYWSIMDGQTLRKREET